MNNYPPPYGQNPSDPNGQTTSYGQNTLPYQQYPSSSPQPPKPPSWWRRQKRITKIGILGCGLPIALIFLCAFCGVVASALPKAPASQVASSASQIAVTPTRAVIHVATSTQRAVPTVKPVATQKAPTPTATVASASVGPAVLGATLGDFKAKYGSLNSHSDPSNGQYYFALYGTDQDDLTLDFGYGVHTDRIILDAPNNQYWSESDAISHCLALLPSDATYQRQMTVRGGDPNVPDIQRVYSVPSLASLFPASVWTDENGNQTASGTVGMILGSWTSGYINCVVQVGLQA